MQLPWPTDQQLLKKVPARHGGTAPRGGAPRQHMPKNCQARTVAALLRSAELDFEVRACEVKKDYSALRLCRSL